MKKQFLLLSLFLLPPFFPAFSQEVYLTENEFQTLLSIIRQSKANSEAQTKLIAELKAELQAQEAALKEALNGLELSEAALTELKSSLARIRDYSGTLNEYCLALEKENAKVKRSKTAWQIGCAGTGAAFLAVLLILVL
jgi:FtsZ-binding cell division protein ZapB